MYSGIVAAALLMLCAGRAHAQGTFDLRIIHMVASAPNVDIYLNNMTPATFADLGYEYASAQAQQVPISGANVNLQVAPVGTGIGGAIVNQNFPVANGTDYMGFIYRTSGQPKMIMLSRPRSKVAGPGKAIVRVLNISSFSAPASFDFYLDSARGTPLFSGVAAEAASAWADVKGEPRTMYITAAGSTTVIAQLIVPLVASGRLTLVVSGASSSELKVHALAGEMVDGYKLPLLQGLQGGVLSSVRVVHAWYQPAVGASGVQGLDIFTDDGTTPKTSNLRYRNASEKYGPFTETSTTVKFAPVNEGAASAVYQQSIALNRDTDYVAILTKTKEGAATALTLGAPNSINLGLDSFRIRAAYVTDFHSDVIVKILPTGMDPIVLPPVTFLTATGWYSIPRGPFTVTAEKPGEAAPFYTKSDVGNFSPTYFTVVVLGSDKTFELDILNEGLPVRQEFDPSSSVPAAPAAGGATLSAVPNPAKDAVGIHFTLPAAAHAVVTLNDVLGRTVAVVADGALEAGPHELRADVASLAPGAYFIRLRTEQGVRGIQRIVVTK